MLLTILLSLAVVTPADTILVVVNKQASTVSIVNVSAGTVTATLPTGANPHEAAASRDGRWAVVTDYGAQAPGSTLTVVDLVARKIARTIQLGYTRPHGIAFLPDNRTVAVTSETGQAVLLVDVVQGTITSDHPTGQRVSHMVAVTADGTIGYTANIADGSLSRIEFGSAAPARVLSGIGSQTEAIGLTPDGREAWLGSNNTGKVLIVNVAQWKVTDSLQTSGFPYRIGFTPNGRFAVVTNPQSDEVHIYDARIKARLGTIVVESSPLGLIFSPDNRTAWITLAGSGEIAEVDLETRTVKRRLPAGPAPDGIAYAATP
jgi:DNA-binding beta-propeller fold protein YncE